jgi:hypothetical protein
MAKLERTEKPMNVLLEELKTGELGLPEIQRGYVWYRPQVRDFIESMYKEYPCGLILLWKPPAILLEKVQLREFLINKENIPSGKNPSFLVLDGQQRLTSLMKVMEAATDIAFNLVDETFQVYSNKLKNNPQWIKVSKIMNQGAIASWLEIKSKDGLGLDDNTALTRLSRLERIKEYRIPVEILHTDDYEEVTESFIRINSRGTRLREAELALARLAFYWPGAVSKHFEEAINEYERNFFIFEARFLMRCYVAVATNQSRFKSLTRIWESSDKELELHWKKTQEALDSTINFLRTNVGIESSEWIPAMNALIPLVVFYANHGEVVSEEEAKRLLFWFLSATIWQRYSGSAETRLDQDLAALRESGIDGMIRNMLKEVQDLIVDEGEIIVTYQRSAFLPLLFAIIRKNKSRDWFSGIELSSTNVGPNHQIELHHFFPRSVLKDCGEYSVSEIDDLCNIVFLSQKANRKVLNSPPKEYIKEFRIEPGRLESQYIPINPELWEIKNYRKFLQERRKAISAVMNRYLKEFGSEYMHR